MQFNFIHLHESMKSGLFYSSHSSSYKKIQVYGVITSMCLSPIIIPEPTKPTFVKLVMKIVHVV